jgi:hypothetical protein
MKYSSRLLIASAALLTTITGQGLAQSTSGTIPIPAGTIFASGKSIKLPGTTALVKAPIYYYSISGMVLGTGSFAAITGTTPVSLATALGTSSTSGTTSFITPYLSGTVVDIKSKQPFTAIDKLAKGSFTFTVFASTTGTSGTTTTTGTTGIPVTVTGQVLVKAGITNKGIPYADLENIKFTTKKAGLGTLKIPASDGLEFTGSTSQIIISTTPIVGGSNAQPDLVYTGTTGSIHGLGVINTTGSNQTDSVTIAKGKTATLAVFLQDTGSNAGSYTLTTSGTLPSGWTQKFIYNAKNVTKDIGVAVTGTATTTGSSTAITFPIGKKGTVGTLSSGGVLALTWKVTAPTSGSGTSFLTATSTTGTTGSNSVSDTIGFSVTK